MAKKKAKPDFSKPKEEQQAADSQEGFSKEVEYEGLPLVVIAGVPILIPEAIIGFAGS